MSATRRRWPTLAPLSLLVALVVALSCSESPTSSVVRRQHEPLREMAPSSEVVGTDFPSVRRLDLRLSAVGPFLPGEPITVTAEVTSKVGASDARVMLFSLDDDPVDRPGAIGNKRRLESAQSFLQEGASQQVAARLTFTRPGYYRVAAIAEATVGADAIRQNAGREVLNRSYEILAIRVSGDGGRTTAAFDATAIDSDMTPLFGAYGPFVARPQKPKSPPGGVRSDALPSESEPDLSTGGDRVHGPMLSDALTSNVSTAGEITAYGYFRHDNLDSNPADSLEPIAGADLTAICVGRSSEYVEDYDLVEQVNMSVGSNGYFSVHCEPPSGGIYDYVDGTIVLRDQNVDVQGPSHAFAGATFIGYNNVPLNLKAANPYAGRVYNDLHTYVPIVHSKMGRSRSRIYVEVHPTSSSFAIHYCPTAYGNCGSSDMITMNYTRVFDTGVPKDGLFVAVHEFAHGFQYHAVEAPGSYGCTNGEHSWSVQNTLSCSFVEGFADFVAMWSAGDRIVSSPYLGDYGLESNLDAGYNATNPPASNDGVRVEAAFAAFLYDLVDGDAEPDGQYNGTSSAETHDSLTVPASWILDVMQHCIVTVASFDFYSLSGPDDVVYCLEKSTSAYSVSQSYSAQWRSVDTVTFGQSVATYDAAKIRILWKYNLYGVSP